MAVDIFYPDADAETSSVDGYVSFGSDSGTGHTWSNLIAQSGDGSDDSATTTDIRLSATSTTDQYDHLRRPVFVFDTSSLTANAVISAATLSLYFPSGTSLGITQMSLTANIYSVETSSDTSLSSSDYNSSNWGSTEFYATDFDEGDLSTDTYNDFSLNASGIANINTTGRSKFGIRFTQEVSGSPTWVSTATNNLVFQTADGANAPKLTVTYTIVTTTSTSTSSTSSTSSSSTSSSSTTTVTATSSSTTSSTSSTTTSTSSSTTSNTSSSTSSSSTTTPPPFSIYSRGELINEYPLYGEVKKLR